MGPRKNAKEKAEGKEEKNQDKNLSLLLGDLDFLPDEILIEIIKYLNFFDTVQSSATSKRFRQLALSTASISISTWVYFLNNEASTFKPEQYNKLIYFIKNQDFYKTILEKNVSEMNLDELFLYTLIKTSENILVKNTEQQKQNKVIIDSIILALEKAIENKEFYSYDINTQDHMRTLLTYLRFSNGGILEESIATINRSLHLPGMNLRGAKFAKKSNLSYSDFSLAELSQSTLADCQLVYADFRESNLRNSTMEYSNLRHADFREALLVDANLSNCPLNNANFAGASLLRCAFFKSTVINADFRDADLGNVFFNNTILTDSRFITAKNISSKEIREQLDILVAKLEESSLLKMDPEDYQQFRAVIANDIVRVMNESDLLNDQEKIDILKEASKHSLFKSSKRKDTYKETLSFFDKKILLTDCHLILNNKIDELKENKPTLKG